MDDLSNSDLKLEKQVLEIAIKSVIKPFDDLELYSSKDDNHSCLIIYQKEQVYYPTTPKIVEKTVTSPRLNETTPSASVSSVTEFPELNCILHPVRIIISRSTLKASLQVFGYEIDSITPVIKLIIKLNEVNIENGETGKSLIVNEYLLGLIKKLTKYGNYRVCRGFQLEDIKTVNLPATLVIKRIPFKRYESPKCSLLINPTQCRDKSFCQKCNMWLNAQNYAQKTKGRLTVERTAADSRTTISKLCPEGKKTRIQNICNSRKILKSKVERLRKKIQQLTNVQRGGGTRRKRTDVEKRGERNNKQTRKDWNAGDNDDDQTDEKNEQLSEEYESSGEPGCRDILKIRKKKLKLKRFSFNLPNLEEVKKKKRKSKSNSKEKNQ